VASASSSATALASNIAPSANAPDPTQEPILLAPDGSALPQTDAKPSVDSPLYQRHVHLLFEAIQKDDPDVAKAFFFPVVAYEQVKAIEKPARDWRFRLWKNFARDVHEYHQQLGPNPSAAVLDHLNVRTSAAKWMKPGSEGNKLGYYRVTGTKILGKKANGSRLELDLSSMISWRGEWYVVHLHGFK
jgi:hypothetical protein